MIKAIERMHQRSAIVQIGATCMGQLLDACYRTLQDEKTGETFCVMLRWACPADQEVYYNVQRTDELIHLWYEDTWDYDREEELEKNGDIELSEEILQSPTYIRVKAQLLRAMKKLVAREGYEVHDDLTVTRAE